jgi:hypothetical protein
VLAGLVLARSSAGLADSTIRGELGHLDLLRNWLSTPFEKFTPFQRVNSDPLGRAAGCARPDGGA